MQKPKHSGTAVDILFLIFSDFRKLFFCQIHDTVLYVYIKLFVVRQLYFIAKMNRISQIFSISANAAADSAVFYE